MDISKVKTAKKIGEFVLRQDNSTNKINIDWCVDKNILSDESPRVYLIVSNNEIKKIGGSASKGGIKNTISFYINARTGSPGPVRFIIHGLIERELLQGKKVELYMIVSPKAKAKICGLFDCDKEKEVASFKEMEDRCKSDYYAIEQKYPDWNFQENHESYPDDLYNEYLQYHENRISRH